MAADRVSGSLGVSGRDEGAAKKDRRWGEGDLSMLGSAKELAWLITHKQPFLFAFIVFCLGMAVLSLVR